MNTSTHSNSHGRDITEQMKETAGKIVHDVQDGASKIGSTISTVSHDTIKEAGKVASEVYDTVREQGQEKVKELGNSIRSYPLISLGCAFLGGVLLGVFARRS